MLTLAAAPLPLLLTLGIACLALWLAYTCGARELRDPWPLVSRALLIRGAAALALVLLATLSLVIDGASLSLPALAVYAALAGLLVAIGWLDLETGMLSDRLTLLLGALALGYDALRFEALPDWLPTLALATGLLALGWFLAGPYSRWRGRDMLGWGDVKFFAAAGLWLLPLQLPVFLIIAGTLGAAGALGYRLATGRAETPFAPALCLALYACVAFALSL